MIKYLAKEFDRVGIYIAWESSTFHPDRKNKVSGVAQSCGSRSIKYMFIFLQIRKKEEILEGQTPRNMCFLLNKGSTASKYHHMKKKKKEVRFVISSTCKVYGN